MRRKGELREGKGAVVLSHGAYYLDGKSYPRVTDILRVVAKPQLEEWRLRVGRENAERIAGDAAAQGSAIHAACAEYASLDYHVATCRPTMDLTESQRLCVDAFVYWLRGMCGCKERAYGSAWCGLVVGTETAVVHQRLGYAGTIDLLLDIGGELVVADIKTGGKIDPIYRLQVAAYAEAVRRDLYVPVSRMLIHLPLARPGTIDVVTLRDEAADRRAWLAALTLWKWQEKCGPATATL